MTFPVYIPLGPISLHPHWVFESLAYSLGFAVLSRLRRRGDAVPDALRWSAVAAAIVGAAIGSKLLYWLEDPAAAFAHAHDVAYLMAGKSILGGLFGGLLAVEFAKWRMGETQSTGDLLVLPLCLGMAVGRIGCFLTGLDDHTFGIATSLPWGVNFGDGVPRHPTQLYESLFMLALLPALVWFDRRPHRAGDTFRLFMVSYGVFRVVIDVIKPGLAFGGLTGTQWAAVAILLYYLRDLPRLARTLA